MASFDQISRRSLLSWMEDGLPELMFGLNAMLSSLVFLLGFSLPRGSMLSHLYSVAAPLLWGGICLATAWMLRKMKQRITFPRRGYMALRTPSWKHVTSAVVLAIFIAVAAIFVTSQYRVQGWTQLVGPTTAAFMALGFLDSWFRYKLQAGKWLAELCLAVGAWIYYIRAGIEGSLWLLLLVGGALIISGGVRFHAFLRAESGSNRRPDA